MNPHSAPTPSPASDRHDDGGVQPRVHQVGRIRLLSQAGGDDGAESARTDPTDRSMPVEMMTIVRPIPRIAMTLRSGGRR